MASGNQNRTSPFRPHRSLAMLLIIGALAIIGIGVVFFEADESDDPDDRAVAATPSPTHTATSDATEEPPAATNSPTEEPTETPPPPTATATASPTNIPPTETPTPEPTATSAPSCETGCVDVGVTLEEFPGPMRVINEYGDLVGRMPDMVMFFQAWGDDDAEFKEWLPDLAELGVEPLITWEPWVRDEFLNQQTYTLESILNGDHDAYIDDWAQRSAAHDGTIYLRFAHEMNSPPGEVYWYPWQGDPETYIAAWRYVHDRFTAAGADNVEWVWSVAWMNLDSELYYPGDEYVDWVAMTVLNFGETVDEPGWMSFSDLYIDQELRASSFGKPVMISELGSAEQSGDKAEWIRDLGESLQTEFPEIGAIIWNNYSAARHVPDANWSVQSSPEALEAWRDVMSSAYFTR
ncbi:MAG: glycoside hydrolase family 26 protein [Chloroflexota bacterium]